MSDEAKGPEKKGHWFTTTSWTMVEDAKLGSEEALERLCRLYWYPIYAYIRRSGYGPEDAEDLAQGFFHHLLKKSSFKSADRAKGRFRSFLLASLKYFLLDQRAMQSAKKRGGGIVLVSLDEQTPEGRYCQEPVSDLSPETLFDQHWARTVLAQVQAQLREEQRLHDKLQIFETLQPFLLEESANSDYERAGAALHMKPSTLAVTLHRLRHRFRELVRAEIARTVASAEELPAEMEHFYTVLGTSM